MKMLTSKELFAMSQGFCPGFFYVPECCLRIKGSLDNAFIKLKNIYLILPKKNYSEKDFWGGELLGCTSMYLSEYLCKSVNG